MLIKFRVYYHFDCKLRHIIISIIPKPPLCNFGQTASKHVGKYVEKLLGSFINIFMICFISFREDRNKRVINTYTHKQSQCVILFHPTPHCLWFRGKIARESCECCCPLHHFEWPNFKTAALSQQLKNTHTQQQQINADYQGCKRGPGWSTSLLHELLQQ